MMKKTIIVFRKDNQYIEDYDYCQGEESHSTTTDPLKAYNLNDEVGHNPAFACHLYLEQGWELVKLEVVCNEIPLDKNAFFGEIGFPEIPYGWDHITKKGTPYKKGDRLWNPASLEWELVKDTTMKHDGERQAIRPNPQVDHPAYGVCNVENCKCCKKP